jgi:hypothetical protein
LNEVIRRPDAELAKIRKQALASIDLRQGAGERAQL